jgi:type IV pilus assembly protein PilB
MKLLQELFGQGLINEKKKEEIEAEIAKTKKTEEEAILDKNIVSESVLFELKSKIFKIPLKKIKAEDVPLEVLELIPEEAAVNYKMAPLSKTDRMVEVGMAYPEDIAAQNALRFLARQQNFNYEVFLINFSDLAGLLKQHRTLKSETKKALEELDEEKKALSGQAKTTVFESISDDAPIIKIVLVILRHAIEGNASDIHIEPSKDRLNVRFRMDGILKLSLFLPLNVHLSIVARVKILAKLKIDENRIPQDGRFSAKIDGKDIDFRVATFPTLYGEKVEMRVLDSAEGLKPFESLGLGGRNLEIIKEAIKKPFGLILSTGPTGSGKTTTLYALLNTLNQESVNIVTIEDPIEYSIVGVNQSQVKSEIGYSFASALRQILRQDPNIIMVGEIRDEETAGLVTHAALTGHIVFSTLHTNSAIGVIPRLIDMGVRPFLIPSTLRAVISQRLIRSLCKNCRTKVRPPEKVEKYIQDKLKDIPISVKKDLDIPDVIHIYEPKGCESCNFKGYSGRIGLFEVFSMTDEMAKLVVKSPIENLILKEAQKQGMLTMEQEGIVKVLSGETSIEEVARVTEET